jgi:hypothetical protein
MAILNHNFNDVPDKVEPITHGTYRFAIKGVELSPAKSGNGDNLILKLQVIEEGKFRGRLITDYIFLNEIGLIKTKNLAKSAGITAGDQGLDTMDLLEKEVSAVVGTRNFTDSDGVEQEGNTIKKYV